MLCHIRCFTSIYFEWIFNVCSIKAIFCSPFFYIWNNVSVVCYSHDVVCLHSLMLLPLFDYNLFIWQEGGEREKKTLTHRGRRRRRRYFIRCHGNLCLMHELLQYDDFIHFVCTFSLIFSFLLLLLVVSLN